MDGAHKMDQRYILLAGQIFIMRIARFLAERREINMIPGGRKRKKERQREMYMYIVYSIQYIVYSVYSIYVSAAR